MAYGIKEHKLQELQDDEIDYELPSTNQFFGSHINLIPMQNAVQGPRLFYGARFYNQAMPLANREAPLVQTLMDGDADGRSFDDNFGSVAGAVKADDDGEVVGVDDDQIRWRDTKGTERVSDLYRNFMFNRKTSINHRPTVKPGDVVKRGQPLAVSNFTDDRGTLALGLNARVGLLPYKGYSMDDAIVVSTGLAKRMTSQHTDVVDLEYDHEIRGGLDHYRAIFPNKFTKDQLSRLDEDGVVREGTILQPGDPILLATRPKVMSSTAAQLGKLSKVMRQARGNAAQIWEGEDPAVVTDVAKTAKGVKVVTATEIPLRAGDKVVFRTGQKGIVSKILPDDHMPRSTDGKPFEVLLNPLGIPSRVNDSLVFELLLGKAAAAQGKPYRIPAFNGPNDKWYDFVEAELKKAGVTPEEDLFDPLTGRKIENPVTTGVGHMMKLHHVAASKVAARSTGTYDANEQPVKGGEEGAKRMSGLETHGLISAGAYGTLRESATLKGQRNDEFWRQYRAGATPKMPGRPFVWDKFRVLLQGAGLQTKDVGGGRLRMGAFTDSDLDALEPLEVKKGELVNLKTLQPIPGGLFDTSLVGSNKWGYIRLPEPLPNPAFEEPIRHLLGLKRRDLHEILAGRMELPEHLR